MVSFAFELGLAVMPWPEINPYFPRNVGKMDLFIFDKKKIEPIETLGGGCATSSSTVN